MAGEGNPAGLGRGGGVVNRQFAKIKNSNLTFYDVLYWMIDTTASTLLSGIPFRQSLKCNLASGNAPFCNFQIFGIQFYPDEVPPL